MSKRDMVRTEIRNLHLQTMKHNKIEPDSPHFLQKDENHGTDGLQKFGSQATFTFRANKGALRKVTNQSRGRQSSKKAKTSKRSTSRHSRKSSTAQTKRKS